MKRAGLSCSGLFLLLLAQAACGGMDGEGDWQDGAKGDSISGDEPGQIAFYHQMDEVFSVDSGDLLDLQDSDDVGDFICSPEFELRIDALIQEMTDAGYVIDEECELGWLNVETVRLGDCSTSCKIQCKLVAAFLCTSASAEAPAAP